ncbi:MAG: GTP 3',8-cyclase MoaA [Deltaproteobacteria bacterium]
MDLLDPYGRTISYLRLSVTDRCNLRCIYCRQHGDFSYIPHAEILRYEEILLICEALSRLGVSKIRLTGGEPLVRKDLVYLAGRLASMDGIEEICITTNGLLLEGYAASLLEAGVTHVNISLDTLRPERFAAITGRDAFALAWRGIEKALEVGFPSIKLNAVVMRGINEDEVVDLARLSVSFPMEVRFIEFMPIGACSTWEQHRVVTCEEIKMLVEEEFGPLKPCPSSRNSGPAQISSISGAPGNLGFISPLSRHFCATCNRIRITPDGRLRLCLFSDEELDVKGVIRGMEGKDPEESVLRLVAFFQDAIQKKPAGHTVCLGEAGSLAAGGRCVRGMSRIGG